MTRHFSCNRKSVYSCNNKTKHWIIQLHTRDKLLGRLGEYAYNFETLPKLEINCFWGARCLAGWRETERERSCECYRAESQKPEWRRPHPPPERDSTDSSLTTESHFPPSQLSPNIPFCLNFLLSWICAYFFT